MRMTGPDFENVYYKNNIAQGVTMQSNYMGVGGTNWGWLPAPGRLHLLRLRRGDQRDRGDRHARRPE